MAPSFSEKKEVTAVAKQLGEYVRKVVAVWNNHEKEQRKHLSKGKGMLSGFKNSLSLEALNSESHWSAWLGDFLRQHLKARGGCYGMGSRLEHKGRSGWEEAR